MTDSSYVPRVIAIQKLAGIAVTSKLDTPHGLYSIADLARREGIDPKIARGRLRKHFGGTLADLGMSNWTCDPENLDLVLSIIRPASGGRVHAARQKSGPSAPSGQGGEAAGPAPTNTINPYAWPRKPRSELVLPATSGVYALFLRDGATLANVTPLDQGLIYIGLGKSLAKRCHFNGRTEGHSPRRSLAALLWNSLALEPRMGANGNYKLTPLSEARLDQWMHDNLLMAFTELDAIDEAEGMLIRRLAPPLNLKECFQSPQHKFVSALRAKMLSAAKASL